jgi:hypothetical protein
LVVYLGGLVFPEIANPELSENTGAILRSFSNWYHVARVYLEYKNLLSLFLPLGLLDHFDIEKVEQGKVKKELEFIHIHMIEKNTVPFGYDPGEYESKGFHRVRKLVDFPIRDKWCI